MTETPDPDDELRMVENQDDFDPKLQARQQNFFAGKDDDFLTAHSTDERIRLWNEAEAKAKENGTTPQEEWDKARLERIKEAKGPNPTQEKARKLYEWWQSGCGGVDKELTEMTADWRPYDRLHPFEQKRWTVLAKALGDHPYHDHYSQFVGPRGQDKRRVERYVTSWAEYDDILNPKDRGYVKLRQHWWQLWRSRHEKLAETSP